MKLIKPNKVNRIQVGVVFLSVLLFTLSLTQTAFCNGQENCLKSLNVFLVGWLGIITGGANLSYLANFSIILVWFTVRKDIKISLLFSVVAVIFALLPLMMGKLSIDEAGTARTITSFEIGYWLWLSSMLVAFVGIFYLTNLKNAGQE